MKREKPLLQEVPLAEYFMERVQNALGHRNVRASGLIEFYLVNLLGEFRKSEKLFEKDGSRWVEKPLALLLARAAEGDAQTKIRYLKQLGDVSLYTAGFFGERLKKKMVGVPYYIRMGEGAYNSLASILSEQKTFGELYRDLSLLFPSLVEVLSEVATRSHFQTNRDILEIYERWLATGDARLQEILKQLGIQTDPAGFQKVQ